jgi:alkaline phosphatase
LSVLCRSCGFLAPKDFKYDLSFSNLLPESLPDEGYSGEDFHQAAAIAMDMETHGGDDVAIYARGPMSHLFQGVHEQHYIALK